MKKLLITLASIALMASAPVTVFAAVGPGTGGQSTSGTPSLEDTRETFNDAGLATNTPDQFVAGVIKAAFGLIGLIAVVTFVAAGFMYLTAFGNASRGELGKKIMIYAVIGIGISAAAFIIADFVVNSFVNSGSQL